jgi:hypothetical protein
MRGGNAVRHVRSKTAQPGQAERGCLACVLGVFLAARRDRVNKLKFLGSTTAKAAENH